MNAQETIRELIDRLRAPYPSGRRDAALELAALGVRAQSATPHLVRAARDISASVRKAAAFALGKIRCQPGVIAALMEALQDENPGVQQAAAEALGEQGADAIQALGALRTATRDLNEGVRRSATQAFRQVQQAIQQKDAA